MIKRIDYNSIDEVYKKLNKKYEGMHDKVSVYGYPTFDNVIWYCLHSGIDKFLLNEEELYNHLRDFRIESNFICLTNMQIQPKLNNWIIKQMKLLDKEIEEYHDIQNDMANIYWYDFEGKEEFEKDLSEKFERLNYVVNRIVENPLQKLSVKICQIESKLKGIIYLKFDKKEILVSDIVYELDKIAIDLQTKLYQEMLEEFPEINEEKTTYTVEDELKDNLKEFDTEHSFVDASEFFSKLNLEDKGFNKDKWYIDN